MEKKKKHGGSDGGFTLIELIGVMVILGIMGSFFAQTAYLAGEGYIDVSRRQELLQAGSLGLERMVREIRSVATATGIDAQILQASAFTFRNKAGDTITYSYGSGTIERNSVPLVESVNSFSFSYYKSDGSAATSGNTLHRVEIAFILAKGGESIPFRATVFPQGFSPATTQWSEE